MNEPHVQFYLLMYCQTSVWILGIGNIIQGVCRSWKVMNFIGCSIVCWFYLKANVLGFLFWRCWCLFWSCYWRVLTQPQMLHHHSFVVSSCLKLKKKSSSWLSNKFVATVASEVAEQVIGLCANWCGSLNSYSNGLGPVTVCYFPPKFDYISLFFRECFVLSEMFQSQVFVPIELDYCYLSFGSHTLPYVRNLWVRRSGFHMLGWISSFIIHIWAFSLDRVLDCLCRLECKFTVFFFSCIPWCITLLLW